MQDQPGGESDYEMADGYLNANQEAIDVKQGRKEQSEADVSPEIEPELFRKYVAYARQELEPRISDDAKDRLREFWLTVRETGTDVDDPIPITVRKLTALVRLAEASARMRLSETVNVNDAERVIQIVRDSLEDVGIDPETEELDADVIETGTSKSQNDRQKTVKRVISETEEETEDGAPINKVIEICKGNDYSEHRIEKTIENLKQNGEAYEPKSGYVRST
jgi:replicative DNA helicase Mcm